MKTTVLPVKLPGLGVVEESVEISVNGVVTLARTNCGLFRLPSASDNSVLMLLLSLRILIPPASAKLIFTSRLQKSEKLTLALAPLTAAGASVP